MLKDFKAFLLQGDVVSLAVAVVIGTAFGAVVNAFVNGIITPLIGMIIAKDFSEMTFTLRGSQFSYGLVISAIISFVSIAAVIFFLVVQPLAAMKARRAAGVVDADAPAPTDDILLLMEIRDLLRAQQR